MKSHMGRRPAVPGGPLAEGRARPPGEVSRASGRPTACEAAAPRAPAAGAFGAGHSALQQWVRGQKGARQVPATCDLGIGIGAGGGWEGAERLLEAGERAALVLWE